MNDRGRLRFESTPATSGQVGPKLKPGAKGRRKLAEAPVPPPILDAPDASPPVEDTPATSGQVGPKLKPGGKFRTDSEKARPSDRLRHEDEPPPVGEAAEDGGAAPHDSPGPKDKKAARDERRFEKSGRRVEKSGDKLDNARDKLAKQKPLKKPGPVKMVGRAAGYQAWKYVHGKIHEVERENVGVEAAHKTELAGEKVIRRTTRFIKKRIRTRRGRCPFCAEQSQSHIDSGLPASAYRCFAILYGGGYVNRQRLSGRGGRHFLCIV